MQKKKLLIVDDDQNILSAVKSHFLEQGYLVEVTNNAMGISYLMQNYKPDLIILDIIMPGSFSGSAIAKTIRQHQKDVKIVFFSEPVGGDLEKISRISGSDDFVYKKHGISKLAETVNSLLES